MDEPNTPAAEDGAQQLDGVNGGGAPEPEQPSPPDPEPSPGDGASALDELPVGKIKVPENTNGHYVVIAARKPKRGQPAQYREVVCLKANDPDHAKRLALEEGRSPKPVDERSATARSLLAAAAEGRGVLLRAVPAMHWPSEVEPTTYVRPEPVLRIG